MHARHTNTTDDAPKPNKAEPRGRDTTRDYKALPVVIVAAAWTSAASEEEVACVVLAVDEGG